MVLWRYYGPYRRYGYYGMGWGRRSPTSLPIGSVWFINSKGLWERAVIHTAERCIFRNHDDSGRFRSHMTLKNTSFPPAAATACSFLLCHHQQHRFRTRRLPLIRPPGQVAKNRTTCGEGLAEQQRTYVMEGDEMLLVMPFGGAPGSHSVR